MPETVTLAMTVARHSSTQFVGSLYAGLNLFAERNYKVDQEQAYYVEAQPARGHGMMIGTFRVTRVKSADGMGHLVLRDIFMSPEGPATQERILLEVKEFVRRAPHTLRVSIVANVSLATVERFGTYCFGSFQHLARTLGYHSGSSSYGQHTVTISNEVSRTVTIAEMVFQRGGVSADVRKLIFQYLPCAAGVYARRSERVSRGVKRVRDQ